MKRITARQYGESLFTELQAKPDAAEKTVANFIATVVQFHDRKKLPDVYRILEELYAASGKGFTITLTTANELDGTAKQQIAKRLKANLEADITLEARADKSIIGGAILKVNNMQYDGSIKTKIHNLYKQFTS
ncbi:MAG: hypothetical protein A3F54_05730 [Candidatus Kerfeldbacteria bacterium RIFCSPHIGHO2_12_FULL_48_17]|uniref:ATP synthase subunit delta n=1 Tax=Candidatus Kerfeldbacteria bacterium RIFCSPHIGHO2_12_FULL_48_17 TaxID=1798542 RepID=A0A1G2B5V0_9BACT|nr:MAG: hypothetical protein A3F54_05730 [Candidatus Kerfeldbacteria bacterium RIFCSPHIGHO2_12_FULL_48_17]